MSRFAKIVSMVVLGLLFGAQRAHSSPLSLMQAVYAHPAYAKLDARGKQLVNAICAEITRKEDKTYYLKKLLLLLDTPYEKQDFGLTKRQSYQLSYAVRAAERNPKPEPKTKKVALSYWMMRQGFGGTYYYVHNIDPLHIVVGLKVRVLGDPKIVEQVHKLKGAIEDHLHVPGFTVILTWSDNPGIDIYTVHADPSKWPTATNWISDASAMSHELMHLLGLRDEYNRIESHAGNKFVPMNARLGWFLEQMKAPTYPDAKQGIMWYNYNKPLPRHVCWAAGLGEGCIKARTEAYGAVPGS